MLGHMYIRAEGVPKDDATAAIWLEKASEQGDSWAKYQLGVCYEHGAGVTRDIDRARRLYKEASVQGNGLAKVSLLALDCEDPALDEVEKLDWAAQKVFSELEAKQRDNPKTQQRSKRTSGNRAKQRG